MKSRCLVAVLFMLVLTSIALPATAQQTTSESSHPRLILATTTSTNDSGLLDYILSVFEDTYNADVDVAAVGTGQALTLGANGDADVVLVHARALEDQFIVEGNGVERYDVMYNDFIVVGPESDPAEVINASSADDAFTRIAEAGAKGNAVFISRGDSSGTYTKEQDIWKDAGITPEGDWYQSAGQGMGAVLNMSNEQQSYTLSDRGTYLARQAEGLDLPILYQGDPILFNPYGVIPVKPEKRPLGNSDLPEQFAQWLISVETQELIASFQIDGQQLFFPDSAPYRAAPAEATPEATPST